MYKKYKPSLLFVENYFVNSSCVNKGYILNTNLYIIKIFSQNLVSSSVTVN